MFLGEDSEELEHKVVDAHHPDQVVEVGNLSIEKYIIEKEFDSLLSKGHNSWMKLAS